MKVTIKDVAKKLNVSITTVSRALDGYTDVSEDTRRRVKTAAAELGYSPNLSARHLRTQRTDSIGYILPSERSKFNESYNAEFFAGLGDAVSKRNFDLLVSTAEYGSEKERSLYTNWTQAKKVDGIVLNRLRIGDDRVAYLRQSHMPFVSLERDPLDEGTFHGVHISVEAEFSRLISHLATLGHSHIGFIGAKDPLVIDDIRYQVFTKTLTQLGITPNNDLVERTSFTLEAGYDAANRMLAKSSMVSAIVCMNDNIALGAMRALEDNGMKAGREIAISGFDGISEAAYANPPLTTIEQPIYETAFALGLMLIDRLKSADETEKIVKVESKLILRRSTG